MILTQIVALTLAGSFIAASGGLTEDFVFATGTYRARLPLVQASRTWRQGIRAFVLVNDTALAHTLTNSTPLALREAYAFYPDNKANSNGHGFPKPGDHRHAIAPFMAFDRYNGSFKWLLWGDDDTIFFLDTLADALSKFDHNQPYLISDAIWWKAVHGSEKDRRTTKYHPIAPRCLPCHLQSTDAVQATCQCTRGRACKHAGKRECHDGRFYVPTPNGGSGVVMSVGLLRKVSTQDLTRCLGLKHRYAGGDMIVSKCLWLYHNIGLTVPWLSSDPGTHNAFDPLWLDRDLCKATVPRCGAECQEFLAKTWTYHAGARFQKKGYKAAAWKMVECYTRYLHAMNRQLAAQLGRSLSQDTAIPYTAVRMPSRV